MSLAEIEAAIPHRKPMLLLDEIVERGEDRIVCRKTSRDVAAAKATIHTLEQVRGAPDARCRWHDEQRPKSTRSGGRGALGRCFERF